MRDLEQSYGKKTFDEWEKSKPTNLRSTRTTPDEANKDIWRVTSFLELLERIAFLGSMNKRLVLLYRGQTSDFDLIPSIFRDTWTCFDSKEKIQTNNRTRFEIWNQLDTISQRLWMIFDERDYRIPRRHGFENTREIPWAIIQHYGLWPTPLIDVTTSLQMATAFAMNFQEGTSGNTQTGYLYVIGLPHLMGSITFNGDEHFTLARLQSVCPPIASRPHLQEGYLMGHFPIYTLREDLKEKSKLSHRLVAKFILEDSGSFWNKDYSIPTRNSLLPVEDPLLERLVKEFGANSKIFPLIDLAKQIEAGTLSDPTQRSQNVT